MLYIFGNSYPLRRIQISTTNCMRISEWAYQKNNLSPYLRQYTYEMCDVRLMRQCQEIFEFRFRFLGPIPQAPDYPISIIHNLRFTTDIDNTGGDWPSAPLKPTANLRSMSPRWNWDSPTPSLASECAPPPEPKVGGGSLACGWGVGGVPIPTTGEKA